MEENLIENIKTAINNVPESFYQVYYVGKSNDIKIAYRERVWCYEFYHQMRKLNFIDESACINGEIDKSGNDNFSKRINPDFLIHKQGTNSNNLCTIEVKLNLDKGEIDKDFCTLTEMLNEHNYKYGIFILINHSFDELKNKYRHNGLKKCFNNDIIILCKKSTKDEIGKYILGDLRNVD